MMGCQNAIFPEVALGVTEADVNQTVSDIDTAFL